MTQVRFDIQYQTYVRARAGAMITGTAVVYEKNRRDDRWKFEFKSLDSRHVMTLACGPLSKALESYKSTAWTGIDVDQCHHHIGDFQWPHLEKRTLRSLVPQDETATAITLKIFQGWMCRVISLTVICTVANCGKMIFTTVSCMHCLSGNSV